MKRLKIVIGSLLLAVVPVLALVQVASAQRFARTIDENQVVHSSVYSSGSDISIKGEIYGDVFCAGQTVVVDATVHGDVICAGMDVTVKGIVDGDIRLAGQTIAVGAQVAGSATLAGSSVSLDAGAKIGRDLTATGGLNIKGQVGRDAVISGENIVLNGIIGRNVAAKGSGMTLKNDAEVKGDLNYTGNTEPKRNNGAVVRGDINKSAAEQKQRTYFNPIFYLIALVGMIFIGVVLAAAFPKYFERTTGRLRTKTVSTLFVGLLAGLTVPAVSFGLAITIVGIPATIFLLIALLFAALLSGPITAYWVGHMLVRQPEKTWLIALVGGAILVTLYFIPFIGFLFMMVAFWLGFGALVSDLYANSRFKSAPAAK